MNKSKSTSKNRKGKLKIGIIGGFPLASVNVGFMLAKYLTEIGHSATLMMRESYIKDWKQLGPNIDPHKSKIVKIIPNKPLGNKFSKHIIEFFIARDFDLIISVGLGGLVNSDYHGIIIAHGTDTMQYTAAFLSFALAGYPIPIALVGSQRSSDRPSSDAALNLIQAARFIVNCNTKGVFVVMHHNESDDLIACHLGTRVRKNHTSTRGAFETIGGDPAFLIIDKKIENNLKDNFFKINDYKPRIKLDTQVALVKYYPGFDADIIDNLVSSGYKALIFEGTGLGHIGKSMYDSVKKAREKKLFMGMTSQCIDGRVNMNVYESGRDLLEFGLTPLSNLIPETALVKAMWALGNSENSDEMKNLMLENIASEFSD